MKYLKIAIPVLLVIIVSAWDHPANIPADKPAVKAKVSCSGFEDREWELGELRFQQNNKAFYYKKDNWEKSNCSFDGDHIRFNANGSGLYHQGNGLEYKLTWSFINDDHSAIEFVLDKFRFDKPLTVTWEKIILTNTEISYVEYYTHANGIHSLGYGTRTSKKVECAGTDVISGDPAKP